MHFDINPGKKQIGEFSLEEIFARERFVSLYLKNSKNGMTACLEMGYEPLIANQLWIYYKNDLYVQSRIKQIEDHEELTPNIIKQGLLREAMRADGKASHAARVAAFTALARIEGLDKSSAGADVPPEDMELGELAKAVKAELAKNGEMPGKAPEKAQDGRTEGGS